MPDAERPYILVIWGDDVGHATHAPRTAAARCTRRSWTTGSAD